MRVLIALLIVVLGSSAWAEDKPPPKPAPKVERAGTPEGMDEAGQKADDAMSAARAGKQWGPAMSQPSHSSSKK